MKLPDAQRIDDECLFTLYTRTPLMVTRGEGMYVWDDAGRRYLDFCSGGRAVNALGHCHPRVVAAIREQAGLLIHTSNDYYTEPQAKLARLLTSHCACPRVFFSNSGSEANEAAIKLARKHGTRDSAARVEVVTAWQSFHGRTFAAMTATGQPKYQQGFAPLVPGFSHVPYNDLAAMDAAITDRTCAVMLEPVLGESGVYPATPEYLAGVRRRCDERGAVLILDEVQTGLGRTGALFAYQHYGIEPDILTLSKALGGGAPIGAMLAKEAVASAFQRGDHATTFGGSALVAAAAYAAVSTIIDEDLPARAAAIGAHLRDGLAALRARHALVTDFRVMGCMAAVDLGAPVAAEVKRRAQDAGLLLLTVGDGMLRLLPALICTPAQVDDALAMLTQILEAMPAAAPA
ncbi:MAG TPA: aspartate aminotransferase family protein [Armatimonadota bacterium]|nr:aspartate aminotransferase family protein [Armatimonadota bacterium]HOS42904.1 aspartate aminotransferase family protein [Armatimonadota bacterium]